jgi:hypothetical protein
LTKPVGDSGTLRLWTVVTAQVTVFRIALERRWNPVTPQNIPHGLMANGVPQIEQLIFNALIAPVVFAREA